MKDKMIRFLTSIHIENIEDFDIDFDMIGKNQYHPNRWDMYIVKTTPWDYVYLRQFLDSLHYIQYDYLMRFSYVVKPTLDQIIELFYVWYPSIYRVSTNLQLTKKDERIHVTYYGEDEYNQYLHVIDDFKSLLEFICYDCRFSFEIKEVEEKPSFTKKEIKKITKVANNEANKSIEEDIALEEIKVVEEVETTEETVEENAIETVEEEKVEKSPEASKIQEILDDVEQRLLEQMIANKKAMEKERQRARLNKRGNYIPVDFISELDSNTKSVDLVAKVFSLDTKEFGGRKRLTIGIYDKAMDAIYISMYQNSALPNEVIEKMKTRGCNIRVRGVAHIDDFSKELIIKGHFIDLLPPDEIVPDSYETKRVELHLHTLMSSQDGVGTADAYIAKAMALGHKAIAVTDHGVTQAFPNFQKASKKKDIKVLYGSELYMVDDQQVYIKNPANIPLNKAKYCVFDLETTGLSARYDKIIEFGAVLVEKGGVSKTVDILINPEREIPAHIEKITDITNDMVRNQPTFKEVADKILEFIGEDTILVSHNADFDIGFIQEAFKSIGYPTLKNPVIDTLALSRYLFPESRSHRLGALCRNMEVAYDEDQAHRADYDANVLNTVWQPMIVTLTKDNYNLTHADLGKLETPKKLLKYIRPHHVTVLVKDMEGLKALHKLVSLGHIEYFADVPKVPRKEIEKLREHLIIGSGCFNGEVFASARYDNEEHLIEKMKFYDFIEVQPLENYSYLINMGDIQTEDELKQYINDIIFAADKAGKIVCATGDCHYVNPEDKVYRDVYISTKAVGGVNHPLMPYARTKKPAFENPEQHYRSTDEMMESFSFLDKEKAYEIVVTNTNLVAEQIENIIPLPNNTLYTPKFENVDEILKNMCFTKAHQLYGDVLPEYIENRLNRELAGIINNKFSVIYYLAHKIVKKANDDGYLVGSRGSVGSSFVATMSDITEVNPLPPHYRCPKCRHFEWTAETYPSVKSGYDLPNKKCPVCGEELIHDGQNIPFETFLGFNAEKTPDIDLNFPGDYQARAHEYTKELLGPDNVFRAGTISTVAEKTAFGYARGYFERLGVDPNSIPRAKIGAIAAGCVGVKRSTGQHPGGIVVIPGDHEVFEFTPVQYPADELNAAWKTTHYDYHCIDNTVLKLDMLGHVDPVALKMMSDLTGVDILSIPMNDEKVLSLFSKPDALGMKSNFLSQQTGAMAIPEFGTNFVRGMLESTRPTTFSDLVIISGLSHGTDVWLNNADKLIEEGKATLQEVIGCRDDIMTYLIGKGLPSNISFAIMEDVRKGKGLKEEYEQIMLANGVPDFYIKSCKAIKYMFPKGHATAYVMMAVRVGYFKVYYPLEFYATYFSVRAKAYEIDTMVKGEEAIIQRYDELKLKSKTKGEKLSPKEEDIIDTLSIAIEMVQRGYKFSNIDLTRSKATAFTVDHETKSLIPPFSTLDGLGEAAATSVIEAREEREFYSVEDLEKRTKLNKTNIDDLRKLGVLKGMPESDQLNLFDFFEW